MTNAAPILGERLPTVVIGPFSEGDLAAYADASGDSNPLHLDLPIALQFGFARRPVHGMRLLAAFEQILRDWRGDMVAISLKGQFLTPVLEGETATLSARVAKIEKDESGPVAVVRLMANTQSGAPAMMGEARVKCRVY